MTNRTPKQNEDYSEPQKEEEFTRQQNDRFVTLATKVPVESARQLSRLARSKGTNIYGLIQLVCDFLIRFMSDQHSLSEEMQRLIQMFQQQYGWKDAFTRFDPTVTEEEIAQEIIITQASGKRGFKVTMIEKPFLGEWKADDNVIHIIERVIEVCLPEMYRRLRIMSGEMGYESICELILEFADNKRLECLNREIAEQFSDNRRSDYGRQYEYASKTRTYQHRTPAGEENRRQPQGTLDFDRTDNPDGLDEQ